MPINICPVPKEGESPLICQRKFRNPYYQKALEHSCQGFFFVDRRFEISNLEIIRDMDRIIIMEEIKSI
jgi:hypothetical protein